MSAGESEAGFGDDAGEPQLLANSRPRDVRLPRAALFDGATRTFLYDDAGRLKDLHPVDQKVALALLRAYGVMAATPDEGNKVKRITHVGGNDFETQVREYMRQAVAQLVTDGDVRELSIPVTITRRGAFQVDYNYVNLRDVRRASADNRRTVTIAR